MTTTLLDRFGRPLVAEKRNGHASKSLSEVVSGRSPRLQARYDAAQTSNANSAYWAASDALSADLANSLGVRKKLRERARYEVANNSYLDGIVQTLANHEIATGPTLQMLTQNAAFNAMVESRWADWSAAVDLPGKLATMVMSRVTDGESFAILITNPRVDHVVQLDLRLVECDQFTSRYFPSLGERYIDGITTDGIGNPISYDVLRYHPGGLGGIGFPTEFDTIAAQYVIHLFHAKRPGQHRGVPEIAPALNLFPGLRRFTAATLKAAETAADIALLFETDLPPGMEPDEVTPGAVEIPYGSAVQAPFGYKAKQIAAEHPNTIFQDFRKEIIGEAARCVNMPRNIATCDSSSYNFASGQLDHLPYFLSISVSQNRTARWVLRPLFTAWFREAVLEYKWSVPASPAPAHQWYWTGRPYSNVVDESVAIQNNLKDGTTTYPLEYARRGLDCVTEWTKQAEVLGMTLKDYQALLVQSLSEKSTAPPPKPQDAMPQGEVQNAAA